MVLIILLFLGHGGIRAAEYVKKHLFSNIIEHPKFISDTKSAIGMSRTSILFIFL
jgi:protein phosphatase 1L